jgi:exodeoxyribonuclease VII large subunit
VSVEERAVISVAELARRLKGALETASGRDWVSGEASSVRQVASGHLYFTLKDEREEACIDCVAYRFHAQRARRHLVDGARVVVFGRATFWAPRGRTQFVVEAVRPAGRGALLEQLARLKEQLAAEGLFDAARKRRIPRDARVVGVVTSADGAAWHDICTVALRRGSPKLVLSAALVQGEQAATSIVSALDRLEKYPGLAVIIVGRGGGSFEDLLAFSDERVVRRIAACCVPVVSAVGHEIDTSLADWVADARAATPSEAAELVVPDSMERARSLSALHVSLRRALRARLTEDRVTLGRLSARLSDPRFVIADKQQWLDELNARIERQLRRQLTSAHVDVRRLQQRLGARHPLRVLMHARTRVSALQGRLQRQIVLRKHTCAQQLVHLEARLVGLSPVAILARGYSIVLDASGQAVRDAREVCPGQALAVRLHRGRLGVEVRSTDVPEQQLSGEDEKTP